MPIQSSDEVRLWLWLSQSEKSVLIAIRKSDIPFLGLLGETLTTEMRQAMDKAIGEEPTVKGYVHRLEKFPALFAVNLAWHVMRGMGQSGRFSLYPHIQTALRLNVEPGQAERERLWQAFRRALLHLGLEPSSRMSGPHYMANEYLRQAGVPLPFVDDLAQRMLSFARRVGLPDDDDPEAIGSWQAALDAKLDLPFSQTARKALEFDRFGFYTRVFLRVHAAGGQPQGQTNQLEVAMAKAFKNGEASTLRRATLPRVVFHSGYLGVFFPGGEEQEWTVDVDGATRQYRTGAEDRFLLISQSLPRLLSVHGHSGGQKLLASLWDDCKTNRLLLFSDTGRLAGRGQLAQPEPLTLPPGAYTALARFEPTGLDTEEISDDPRLVSFSLLLRPGEHCVISNGPAQLHVHADSQPLARWLGDLHASKEGMEFRHGALDLVVEMPADWLTTTARYELTLLPGDRGEARVVSLDLDSAGQDTVSISGQALHAGWKPGLMHILVELRRAGEPRVLLRCASLYWLGLKEIRQGMRFRCTSWPENLRLEFSENVERSGDDLILRNSNARVVRLVFALGEKRQQSLTWNVPGIFVEVEDVAEGGIGNRLRRTLGSTEVVSLTSTKQIVVIASDDGILRLGEWSERVGFAHRATKVLPATFLASRLTPQSHTLVYVNENTGVEHALLRLAQPHAVSRFSAQVQSGQFVMGFHVSEHLEALSVHATALLSGDDDLFKLHANAGEWTNTRFGRARLMVLDGKEGGHDAQLYINLSFWPAGAWLFKLDGQIRGVWGHLENSRQDVFAAGLLLGNGGQILVQKEWLGLVNGLEDLPACRLLQRVHVALLVCYAQEAWDNLTWLAATWKALTERWRGREAQVLTPLADLAAMPPPEETSASWLPQLVITAALPGLFALPAQEYRRVHEKPHPLSRALRAMGGIYEQWPMLFPDLLHFAPAAGCANFAAISSQGSAPKGFDPQRYVNAMCGVPELGYVYQISDDAFLPGPKDYLGPLHYRHAWRALEVAYERTLVGNDIWRGQGIGLAQHAHRMMPTLGERGVPLAWRGQAPHLTPWPACPDEVVDDQVLQERENLGNIAHLLAGLAFACRQEARQPGALQRHLNQLDSADIPLDKPLAFLLQIGEALFAYYLLLWELVLTADYREKDHERVQSNCPR
ncbi:hypothetical protein FNU76_23545 [Chitinimonas arctica]|uniref:Uncharacterized protein n=1 Tax=Chitinimonas arctica TaxID=2594795 RepID=A0A516SLR9_9NEIS|nr:hypothetical protein [Chitinimonas arctica]QDQ29085.1 hypothetical protein FNU76_23545 [Chitinimonas arctica]